MSEQVKLNCSRGSDELSGEQSEELSDEHPMLEMSNDKGPMSNETRANSNLKSEIQNPKCRCRRC